MMSDLIRGMRRAVSDRRWYSLMALFVVLDQLSKLLVVEQFALGESVPVIPGFFDLVYVRNLGAAFGIFSGMLSPWREILLLGATGLALGVILSFLGGPVAESRWGRISLALICGGAFGNLVDRVAFGYVVDFLDFYVGSYHWPAFNLADSFICVGVAMLLFTPVEERQQEGAAKPMNS